MKKILQNLRTGQTTVEDVPSPGLGRNSVLIQTCASLISAGTERMLVEFGKVSLLAKARSQPDKVRRVRGCQSNTGMIYSLRTMKNNLPMQRACC